MRKLLVLAALAEYEPELISEPVNAGVAAAKQNGIRFGRPRSDPAVIAEKLGMVGDARARSRTPRTRHAWSGGTGRRSTDASRPWRSARARRRIDELSVLC